LPKFGGHPLQLLDHRRIDFVGAGHFSAKGIECFK
jgi:hypothetical protein